MQIPNHLSKRDKLTLRNMQIVFQNQDESFSPYLKVEEILARPLQNLLDMDRKTAFKQVKELLSLVQIPANYAHKYTRQLSGGEKQRVAIAQAFAVNPNLLIADEPVSSLDVSVQASILNLLNDLQKEYQTSNLIISHNIAVVTYMADEVLVMYLGQEMQCSISSRILSPPYHPYTEVLLTSLSVLNADQSSQLIRFEGDPPDLLELPAGCLFHTRCPRSLGKQCEEEVPAMQISPEGERIFCHIPIAKLQVIQEDLFHTDVKGIS
jgi:peptide/nickel transport system ATP-binding protein